MKKNLLFIILLSLNAYSQHKGIGNFGFTESNVKEIYFHENEIVAKEIIYSNFMFKEDLIKLDFVRDNIFIENHSSKKESYEFKYFYFKKNVINNDGYLETNYYLKKTDTIFLNYKKVDFVDYEPDKKIIDEANYIGINLKNAVYIYKLNKCYIIINKLGINQYEIEYYLGKKQIDSIIVNYNFLNKFYTINEKLFLNFDNHVIVFYLY